jgi:hypothetical protein
MKISGLKLTAEIYIWSVYMGRKIQLLIIAWFERIWNNNKNEKLATQNNC